MNTLSMEKKALILNLLSEGNSIRAIERLSGVHRDTIMRLTVTVGKQCREFMDAAMMNLKVGRIQIDEIWTFVGKKQKRLTDAERYGNEFGDQYVFVAIDADTKLVPAFRVGKRSSELAVSFLTEVRTRTVNTFQLSTDSFGGYRDAVDRVFGTDIHYGQVHKQYQEDMVRGERRYSPAKIVRVIINPLVGQPDPKHISTSFVERQNLTMRMQMRRFTRLTNAYSKKLENLEAALALHFWHYNFARVHESLRVTPAMEAGISKHILTWEYLLNWQEQRIAA
jgi:IS1 family transposase